MCQSAPPQCVNHQSPPAQVSASQESQKKSSTMVTTRFLQQACSPILWIFLQHLQAQLQTYRNLSVHVLEWLLHALPCEILRLPCCPPCLPYQWANSMQVLGGIRSPLVPTCRQGELTYIGSHPQTYPDPAHSLRLKLALGLFMAEEALLAQRMHCTVYQERRWEWQRLKQNSLGKSLPLTPDPLTTLSVHFCAL